MGERDRRKMIKSIAVRIYQGSRALSGRLAWYIRQSWSSSVNVPIYKITFQAFSHPKLQWVGGCEQSLMGHLFRSLNTRKRNWEMSILRRVNKPLRTHAIIGRVHVFWVCRRPMPLYNLERHWFRPIHLSSHSHRGTVSRFNQGESKADQTAVVDLHWPLFLGDWWKHFKSYDILWVESVR